MPQGPHYVRQEIDLAHTHPGAEDPATLLQPVFARGNDSNAVELGFHCNVYKPGHGSGQSAEHSKTAGLAHISPSSGHPKIGQWLGIYQSYG